MDGCQSDGSVSGEPHNLASAEDAVAGNALPTRVGQDAHEGDVIRGLRSGLIFSLAIWAALLTFGVLVFD